MTMQNFTLALDIYPPEFVQDLVDFAALIPEIKFPFPLDFHDREMRLPHRRPWDVKQSKGSEVRPEFRLIHHVISRSAGGKYGSKDNLTTTNVLLIWSMQGGQKLHLGQSILQTLCWLDLDQRLMGLHGGAYITRIA
ncbi:unnamed protein product [Linum trigynum]|uniref:Uncharacterized protein n=1 Tax=Linum trigynum TaxID=586398 RepID=A0AAV2CX47_9ROSI